MKKEYPDVPKDMWYTPYIETATELGIMEGYEDGTFRPNNPLTRAQAAAIIVRLYQKLNMK